jgi:hypothetical protein
MGDGGAGGIRCLNASFVRTQQKISLRHVLLRLRTGDFPSVERFGTDEEYKSKTPSLLINSCLFVITALHQSEY